MSTDLARVEAIIEPICRAHGVELVEVRFAREPGGAVLRVLIDRERPPEVPMNVGGVTLDDCKNVSRDLSTALDVEDAISGKYRLEISSPGIERPLVKERDFVRFAGQEAKIVTKLPQDGSGRKVFQGILRGFENGSAIIGTDGEQSASIALGDIAKAHLVHRWEQPSRHVKKGKH